MSEINWSQVSMDSKAMGFEKGDLKEMISLGLMEIVGKKNGQYLYQLTAEGGKLANED